MFQENNVEREKIEEKTNENFIDLNFSFTFKGKESFEKKVLNQMSSDPNVQKNLCQAILFFTGSLYGIESKDEISLVEMKVSRKQA